VDGIMRVLALVLVFWNPRGILNKEVEFKSFLSDQGAVYAGISETKAYQDGVPSRMGAGVGTPAPRGRRQSGLSVPPEEREPLWIRPTRRPA